MLCCTICQAFADCVGACAGSAYKGHICIYPTKLLSVGVYIWLVDVGAEAVGIEMINALLA